VIGPDPGTQLNFPIDDLGFGTGAAGTILRRVLGLEASLVARIDLPFGLTVLALAERR
jgi:hypothetical protein